MRKIIPPILYTLSILGIVSLLLIITNNAIPDEIVNIVTSGEVPNEYKDGKYLIFVVQVGRSYHSCGTIEVYNPARQQDLVNTYEFGRKYVSMPGTPYENTYTLWGVVVPNKVRSGESYANLSAKISLAVRENPASECERMAIYPSE